MPRDYWYQPVIVDRTRQAIQHGWRRPVIVSPTGSGKTHIAAEIVRLAQLRRKKVLFFAPRRELIYQTLGKFQAYGIDAGMIMAGEPSRFHALVQVASFDTVHVRGIRKQSMMMPEADIVIVDEAHLSLSKGRQEILNHYSDAIVIGLTATPVLGNGSGLGGYYDSLINEVSVKQLMDEGYLVRPTYYAPTQFDLHGVRENKSDYILESLGEAVDKPKLIGDIVSNWKRLAHDKQTVVFCVNRKHSRHICDEFNRAGYRAEHVDGETDADERAGIMQRVRNKETQILCNVFVASYGLDIPSLECAILARPTKNIGLYLQTVGRILRPSEGKHEAIVIDHTGAVSNHGFVDDHIPWSLDTKDIRQDKKKREERERKPVELTCEKCKTVFSGQRHCPACGHEKLPPTEEIPVRKATLEKVNKTKKKPKDYTREDKLRFHAELTGYGETKGYAPGWASNQYREKFGEWPQAYRVQPRSAESKDVLGWIKHKQIKYARRR